MSGLQSAETSAEPQGLIVMVRANPTDAARALAADLHAELAIGGTATEAALERLASHAAREVDLDALADAMRRADDIRDRTRSAAGDRLARQLNTTIAIHPDTLRRAAESYLSARAEVTATEARLGRRRRRRLQARIGAGGTTAAGAAIGVLALPPVGIAVAAVGIAGAASTTLRRRRRPGDELLLAEAACELARRRWEQVAGVGADPCDVDAVVHQYDPQHRVISDLIASSPAVRAADRVARERRMRWVAAWRAEVGDRTPIDPAVQALLGDGQAELWLTESPDPAPETLVVVDPYQDLPDDRARRLHMRLLGLRSGHRIIVVLAPDPASPGGARIPGVGWVPAVSPPAV